VLEAARRTTTGNALDETQLANTDRICIDQNHGALLHPEDLLRRSVDVTGKELLMVLVSSSRNVSSCFGCSSLTPKLSRGVCPAIFLMCV